MERGVISVSLMMDYPLNVKPYTVASS